MPVTGAPSALHGLSVGVGSEPLPQGVKELHIAVKNVAELQIEVDGAVKGTVVGVQVGGWSGVQYLKISA